MARDYYDDLTHLLRQAGWSKTLGGKTNCHRAALEESAHCE
jgi:hypothetical protein